MGKNDRADKRRAYTRTKKMKNRTYNYDEVNRILLSKIQALSARYDEMYTLVLANALSAEPFKFGKKRVCEVLRLFFDQVEGLKSGTIESELMIKEAERLGVFVKTEDGKFKIELKGE